MGWYLAGLVPIVCVTLLTILLYVRRPDRKAPPVAVLESRGPREAVQSRMNRGD